MAKSLVPLRPDNYVSPLTQDEQSALTWMVLSGCSRKDAYVTFARPDMLSSKAKASFDDYVKQFFAQREVKEYLDAYEATLLKFLKPAPVEQKEKLSMEEKKSRARAKAIEFAMTLADNLDQADDPEMVMKLLDKVGILDVEEEAEEQPRRYLPVTCSGCEYRKFVEENCDIVDTGTEVEGKSNQTP